MLTAEFEKTPNATMTDESASERRKKTGGGRRSSKQAPVVSERERGERKTVGLSA